MKFIVADSELGSGSDTAGGFYQEVEMYSTTVNDAHFISKPFGVGWKEYNGTTVTAPWSGLTVIGKGLKANATDAIRVEIVYNLECTVDFGQMAASLAKPGMMSNPVVLAAASHTHSKTKHNHRGDFEKIMADFAKAGLIEAGKAALPFIGGWVGSALGGPPGGVVGSIAGSAAVPLLVD
jgi:hypothetical protein